MGCHYWPDSIRIMREFLSLIVSPGHININVEDGAVPACLLLYSDDIVRIKGETSACMGNYVPVWRRIPKVEI